MEPFVVRYKDLCDELTGLWKVGEGDKAMETLFKAQFDPDLSLSDRVSVNLSLASIGNVERMDCEKLADDALYVCEAVCHLRDILRSNISIPELSIADFESLEIGAYIRLYGIARREKRDGKQGKLLHKDQFTKEQRLKRRDYLRVSNAVDILTMLKIVDESGDSVLVIPPGPALDGSSTPNWVHGGMRA